jgi:hypothetical protein
VDRLRDIMTRSLDRDVVILLEVDAGVLLGRVLSVGTEKLALDTGVSRTRDVLSVAPLSVTGTTSREIAAAAAARVAVEVAASAISTSSAAAVPATTTTAVVLEGRRSLGAIAPVGLASTVVLVSPSAVAETVGGTLGNWSTRNRAWGTSDRRGTTAVYNGRRSFLTRCVTHVRRNVRSSLAALRLAFGTKVEAAHVELISHVAGKRVANRVDGVN